MGSAREDGARGPQRNRDVLIRTLAIQLGAEVDWTSTAGGGTCLRCDLPSRPQSIGCPDQTVSLGQVGHAHCRLQIAGAVPAVGTLGAVLPGNRCEIDPAIAGPVTGADLPGVVHREEREPALVEQGRSSGCLARMPRIASRGAATTTDSRSGSCISRFAVMDRLPGQTAAQQPAIALEDADAADDVVQQLVPRRRRPPVRRPSRNTAG